MLWRHHRRAVLMLFAHRRMVYQARACQHIVQQLALWVKAAEQGVAQHPANDNYAHLATGKLERQHKGQGRQKP
jgi:DNA-binding FrmR family transcriptional regulator